MEGSGDVKRCPANPQNERVGGGDNLSHYERTAQTSGAPEISWLLNRLLGLESSNVNSIVWERLDQYLASRNLPLVIVWSGSRALVRSPMHALAKW
jgi:hypothetical protein